MSQLLQKNSITEDLPVLETHNLYFSYNRKYPIIQSLDFIVKPSEIVGISGENGSGKSTLLKLLVGLLTPQKGEMNIRGRIGYSPQDLLLFENLTVLENFQVFGRGIGLSQFDIEEETTRILTRLKFLNYKNTLIKNLSGGTAQKANFGLSLLGNPDVLILDEPYQGMDYASYLAFWEIQKEIRNSGKSVIIVSHLIEDKSKFTRALHLINGKLQGCTIVGCPECGDKS
ncbi:MAG: ATP-binding cassette domain-containing protein [Candidatus Hodarchaeales archaeon]|jgi:ABC-type multidrug transport system ATPase subunit